MRETTRRIVVAIGIAYAVTLPGCVKTETEDVLRSYAPPEDLKPGLDQCVTPRGERMRCDMIRFKRL